MRDAPVVEAASRERPERRTVMDDRRDTTTDAASETSPCPCLAFDGPFGCPACQGRGELTAADVERYLGRDQVTCPWCAGRRAAPGACRTFVAHAGTSADLPRCRRG